jgi:hypothetical protein
VIHAEIETVLQCGDRIIAIRVIEIPCALADHRHLPLRRPEPAVFHL